MGLYDNIHVSDPCFVCSEGHDLTNEEFQSKDFGCTMGDVTIGASAVAIKGGDYGTVVERPLLGRFYAYCTCTRCPAFVQAETFNLVPTSVEFCVEIIDDVIRAIRRTSPSTAEFIDAEPKRTHMRGCAGPMTYQQAQECHSTRRLWAPQL